MTLQGKKVLVTGADGFIGSHLAEMLLAAGCRVRAFVLYNSFNSWGWLDTVPVDVSGALEVHAGDVRDSISIREAMRDQDIVFHLAALIAIPHSYRAPESYIDTNIKGTLHVLQAARDLGTPRLLVTSTSEVYGTAQYVPIDERHPFQGQSPYSASKIGADRLAESFWRSFDVPVTIVRPFNTYGPRQSARAIIPAIITQLLSGAETIRLGNLRPTRDLNFVMDTCRGFLAIAESESCTGDELNIATQQETSMEDLARMLIEMINPSARIVQAEDRLRPAASEVERLLGSSTRLRRLTGWEPRFSLAEGLAATVAWFRVASNISRYKAALYNV